MAFLDLLAPQGDKVNAGEMSEIKRLLPDHIDRMVPFCMYCEPNMDNICEIDYEVLTLLTWIRARRDNPEITQPEVANRIGARNKDQIDSIVEELWYFYTTFTREEVAERTLDDGEDEDGVKDETENPTPDETVPTSP